MYIGSRDTQKTDLYVYENNGIILKSVDFCPGMYKIIDEIYVNSLDNYFRYS